jgi:glycosyltransferase involved in cell wall biosynthesis
MTPRSVLLVGNFHLAERGCPPVGEELAGALREAGWHVLTASRRVHPALRLLDMLAVVHAARPQYAVAQIDVFSGRAFVWAEAVAAALQACGKPFVLSLHGGLLPEFAARWPRRVRRLLGAASAVTAPSPYLASALRPYRSDLLLLPNGLRTTRYPYRERTCPRPRLLWLRAFHQVYNPSLALRTIAALRRDWPEVRLQMVGPDHGDGTLAAIRAELQAAGLADCVQLVGRVPKDEVPRHLDAADILLNTPRADNAPVSLLEAFSAGLCVVSTDVGGIPFLVEDGRNALLVPSDQPEQMAAAVRRILSRSALGATLSRAARATALSYDWQQILPRWTALLERVAGVAYA